jgi:hypothetical protein
MVVLPVLGKEIFETDQGTRVGFLIMSVPQHGWCWGFLFVAIDQGGATDLSLHGGMNVQAHQVLIGIDDTDTMDSTMGTGKLTRLLWKHLEGLFHGLRSEGVVRLQLLVDPRIHYTSHNSPACLILSVSAEGIDLDAIADASCDFIRQSAAEGSDPGVCVAPFSDVPQRVIQFGLKASGLVVDRKEAEEVAEASNIRLKPLGGDGSGIIGALAAVGLTVQGNCGRYLDLGPMRDIGEIVTIDKLRKLGIEVVSTDREARALDSWEEVKTGGWLRPRRIFSRPVLFVEQGQSGWICYDKKHGS